MNEYQVYALSNQVQYEQADPMRAYEAKEGEPQILNNVPTIRI